MSLDSDEFLVVFPNGFLVNLILDLNLKRLTQIDEFCLILALLVHTERNSAAVTNIYNTVNEFV